MVERLDDKYKKGEKAISALERQLEEMKKKAGSPGDPKAISDLRAQIEGQNAEIAKIKRSNADSSTTSQPRKGDVTGCQFGALEACPVVPGGWPHPTGWWGHPNPNHRKLPRVKCPENEVPRQPVTSGASAACARREAEVLPAATACTLCGLSSVPRSGGYAYRAQLPLNPG
jgi:hypothetical protein